MSNANNHTNAVELKSIFNLFDQNNTGEIEIKQINQFLKSIDSLKLVSYQEKKKIKPSDSNENLNLNDTDFNKSKENFNNNNEKDSMNLISTLNNNEMEENLVNYEKNENTIDLKVFPNKKTSINFNEFSSIFNEALSSKDLQEELLLSSFSVFDYNRLLIILKPLCYKFF